MANEAVRSEAVAGTGPSAPAVPEYFQLSIDTLPYPAVLFDADGIILRVNSATVALFEADNAEQLVGNDIYQTCDPDMAERAAAVAAELRSGKKIRLEKWRMLTVKGNRRMLDVAGIPAVSEDGTVKCVLGVARDVGDEDDAEHERALLAAIVQSSDDAIVGLSPIAPQYAVMSWNKGAEKLFGFTAAEAIGRSIAELYVLPELRSDAQRRLQKDLEALIEDPKIVRRLEVPVSRKDGTRLDVSIAISGIYDSAGKLLGMSSIVRDITAQKRSQREQGLLAALVKSSEDAVMSVDPDGAISSWNAAAEKIFGFTAAEAIGQDLVELLVPPASRERARAGIRREFGAAAQGRPLAIDHPEVRVLRKDGTMVEASVSVSGIYDAAGTFLGASSIVSDITERKKAERELATLASIVNASEDVIVSVDRDTKVITWNPAAERIYGFKAAEAMGHSLELFVPPEELEQDLETDRRILQTGETASFEHRPHGSRGDGAVSLVNLFPIRDAEGKISGVGGISRDITRLKQVEAELREAHEYTRGLIESSIDAMVMVDREMRIMDGNQQLAQLIETPKKTLIGTQFENYFSDPAAARAAIQKTFTEGYVSNLGLVIKAASGKEIAVSFNTSLFYKAGVVFCIFGVARDVTEQRATERRLLAEREYSRTLVQSSPDALLVTDASVMLSDVNERTLELTGYTREELKGNPLPQLFTDPARVQEVMEEARNKQPVHDVELVLVTKNGRCIPVVLNASAFRDGEPGGHRIVVALRDATESKRAQMANSLLASIVDSSGDAIYSKDANMIVTSWNPAAEALFGYSAAEVIGRSAALIVPLDRRAELAQYFQRIKASRKAEQYETVRLRKDGSRIAVAVTQSPIVDGVGEVAGLSVMVRDIGDRRRMEAELTEARDAALEGARLKSEFLANMSHEIRTPLNSVIGLTGLLLDTTLSAEQREFVSDVRESGNVLLALINDILDFSKINAGKLVLEEIDFDLTHELEATLEVVADQARHKALELTLSVEADVPRFLHGDAARLRQILINLLGNGIKFTEHGEVAVSVSKLSENPRETMLRFEVRDTGIGIAKDKLDLLFQPFTQVDASTSRQYGGTGLGLSIARDLVERMEGTIAVTSTVGAGSTFWFTLNLGKQVNVGKPASERFASLAGTKVLIVDDNANSRRILERQVSSWGMRASTAASGDEALEMLRGAAQSDPYQVALLDVMMPGMDGIDLAHRIKGDPALAATAIIFVSSAGRSKEFKARLERLAYARWLMKPAPESSLYDALTVVLEGLESGKHNGAEESHSSRLQSANGRKLRVLLAEDNPINQKVAVLQARKLGLEIDAVSNGLEAVQAIARLPYDVILMDCAMPEMDGYEATREIRRREGESGGPHTLIVAMTAHALPGDREKCIEAGMDGYISKPVTLGALEHELADVLAAQPPLEINAGNGHPPAAAGGSASPQQPIVPAAVADQPAAAPGSISRDRAERE